MAQNTLDVSIIVPVFNMERFLPRCFENIDSLTEPKPEIVIVDDGSTDNSYALICGFAASRSFVKVVHQPYNQGIINAKVAAFSYCTGGYIGTLDPDDYTDPLMYVKLLSVAQKHHASIVQCGAFEVSDNQSRLFFLPETEHSSTPFYDLVYYGVHKAKWHGYSFLIRSDVYKGVVERLHNLREHHISNCDDLLVLWIACRHSNDYRGLQEPLYYYVRHGGAITTTRHLRRFRKAIRDGKRVVEFIRQDVRAVTHSPPRVGQMLEFIIWGFFCRALEPILEREGRDYLWSIYASTIVFRMFPVSISRYALKRLLRNIVGGPTQEI